jgi:hypothetical protein
MIPGLPPSSPIGPAVESSFRAIIVDILQLFGHDDEMSIRPFAGGYQRSNRNLARVTDKMVDLRSARGRPGVPSRARSSPFHARRRPRPPLFMVN